MHQDAPQELIARMISGHWLSQAVYVAAKLTIADRLAAGPRTARELAQQTGTHPRSLYRLLRALASVGLFSEDEEHRFRSTPLGDCLRKDVPGSQWPMAVMMGEELYRAWGELLYCVQTGKTGFEKLFGKPIFQFLAEHPEQARVFDAAMTAIHGRETAAMLDAYDLSGVSTLADVGGGNGITLIGILNRYPRMRGILFDLPSVVERSQAHIEAAGLSDRCKAVAGDFFEAVAPGADAYLLRHIIHDWDDDQATTILRTVRRAMKPDARLLVVESIIRPGNDPAFAKLLDLTMLVAPGGLERTEEEYRRLYEAAGFQLTSITPTSADVSVIEGRPT